MTAEYSKKIKYLNYRLQNLQKKSKKVNFFKIYIFALVAVTGFSIILSFYLMTNSEISGKEEKYITISDPWAPIGQQAWRWINFSYPLYFSFVGALFSTAGWLIISTKLKKKQLDKIMFLAFFFHYSSFLFIHFTIITTVKCNKSK